jgi:hypothetical protein
MPCSCDGAEEQINRMHQRMRREKGMMDDHPDLPYELIDEDGHTVAAFKSKKFAEQCMIATLRVAKCPSLKEVHKRI